MSNLMLSIAGFLLAVLAMIVFCTFVTWGESPSSWSPVSRFVTAAVTLVAGCVSGILLVEWYGGK